MNNLYHDHYDLLATQLKILSDPTRLRILMLLSKKEARVYEIVEALNMTQSAISHQLKTLRTHRLVNHRRDGKTVFYRLFSDHVSQIVHILNAITRENT